MGKLESLLLATWHQHILLWKRFIDDIFFIFTGTFTELQLFQDFMNSFHRTIKFTFESSYTSVNFLDTTAYLNNKRKLFTTLYKKPTDCSFLLHFTSHHPLHIKKSIIHSQALRLNLINREDHVLQNELYKLTRAFLARGYQLKLINANIIKALQRSRTELLERIEEHHSHILPLVAPYFNVNHSPNQIISKHWEIIENDEITSTIFANRPIHAYTNKKSIKDLIIRALRQIHDTYLLHRIKIILYYKWLVYFVYFAF